MKPRHARQIRVGIRAAKYVEKWPRLRLGIRVQLGPQERHAFDEYEARKWKRAMHKRFAEARKQRAHISKQREQDRHINRQFADIINHETWGK